MERDQPDEGERGDAGARVAGDAVTGVGPLVILAPHHKAVVMVRHVGLEHDQPQHVIVQPRPRARRPPRGLSDHGVLVGWGDGVGVSR